MISTAFETVTKPELPNMSSVLFKVRSSHESHEGFLKNIEKDGLSALCEKEKSSLVVHSTRRGFSWILVFFFLAAE